MPIIFLDRKSPSLTNEPPEILEDRPAVSIELADIGANIDNSKENLSNEDFDVTWGGKKSRYLYNYEVQDTCSENSDDTDQTESVLSIQSKTTLLLESEPDIVAGCPPNCECRNSQAANVEYEPVSTSDSFMMDDSNFSSDSTVLMDYKFPKKMVPSDISSYHSSDTGGYVADEIINIDDQVNTKGKKIPPPACFKKCLQCRKDNSNAYFQYCYTCFKNRMDFFEEKPKPKKKKRCNSTIHTKSSNSFVDYQKPGPSISHQSGSVSMSKLLSQKIIDQSKNIGNDSIEMRKRTKNICKVCFMMPQNGVFNHGKVGHIFSCYKCTKDLYKKSKKCPICNVRVKFITKMIVV